MKNVRNPSSASLDAVGLLPGLGEIADGVNGGISLLRGDYVDAALSFASMIPFAGWASTAGKWGKKALKYSDEVLAAVKHADEAGGLLGRSGRKTGKFIDNTFDPISKAEKQVIDDLVGQGKKVERIPKDPMSIYKTPDFKVDGMKTELKTLGNANTNTGMKRIQDGFKQGADIVIVDARGTGLTSLQASEIISRACGKYPNKKIPGIVEIWIDEFIITYP